MIFVNPRLAYCEVTLSCGGFMQFSQAKSRDSVAHMECTLPITAYVSVQHVRYTSTVKAGLSPKNRFPADQDLLQEAPKLAERKNEEWLSDLRTPGLAQETALSDLRSIIRSGLHKTHYLGCLITLTPLKEEANSRHGSTRSPYESHLRNYGVNAGRMYHWTASSRLRTVR